MLEPILFIGEFGSAQVPPSASPVTSVNAMTGAVTLSFAHVGAAPTVHTHTASQITDFSEAVDDRVAVLLTDSGIVTITYDDAGNALDIAVTAVTSVDMSVPSILAIAGNPITSSGTLLVTLATQSANLVFSGPSSGGAVAPTFRALVSDDIPSLDAAKITTGTFGHARLGSGGGGASKFLREDSTWQTVTGGVTSVDMSVPSILSVAGNPITTSGTLAVTLATQSANLVFSGPSSGGAVTPTFRPLVSDDIPSLDAAKITTGTFGHARLGSGGGGATKYLREDSTWQSISATLIPGTTPITGGGNNRIFYENTSNVLHQDANFLYSSAVGNMVIGTSSVSSNYRLNIQGTSTIGGIDVNASVTASTRPTVSILNAGAQTNFDSPALFVQTASTSNTTYTVYIQQDSATTGVNLRLVRTSNATTTAPTVMETNARTSGTPGTDFGAAHVVQLASSTTNSQDASRSITAWSDATHVTRTSYYALELVNGAAALARVFTITGAGEVRIGTTANYIGLAVSAPTSYTITLPSAAPGSNTVLTYNGSAYVWSAPSVNLTIGTTTITGGATTQILYNNAGVLSSNGNFAYDFTNNVLSLAGGSGSTHRISVGTSSISVMQGTTSSTNQSAVSITQSGNLTSATVAGFYVDQTNTSNSGVGIYALNRSNSAGLSAYFQRLSNQTSTAPNVMRLDSQSSGTPAAGFGIATYVTLHSSTTASQDAALVKYDWSVATHATRTSRYTLQLVNAGGALADVMAINGDGTVGIGIAPDSQYKFQVSSSGAAQWAARFINSVSTSNYVMTVSAGGALTSIGSGAALFECTSVSQNTGGTLQVINSSDTTGMNLRMQRVGSPTATALPVVKIDAQSTGTAAAGFGASIEFELESSTTTRQDAALMIVDWLDATHATKTSQYRLQLVNSASTYTDVLSIAGGGAQTQSVSTANTSTVQTTTTILANSTGTAAAGFGVATLTQLESSTTNSQDASKWITAWDVATHATRTSYMSVQLVYLGAALAETFRFDANGNTTQRVTSTTATGSVLQSNYWTITTSGGTVSNGFGTYWSYDIETDGGGTRNAAYFQLEWADAADGTYTSRYSIWMASNASVGERFRFDIGILDIRSASGAYYINGTKVVSFRDTGWAVDVGVHDKTAKTVYAGQTVSAGYVQSEAQATDDRVKILSEQVAALKALQISHHGLAGA